MRSVGVLGLGLLVAGSGRASPPAAEVFDWIAAADVSDGVSYWRGGPADGRAVAAGAMASLGANLSPNPLAGAWARFPVATPLRTAKREGGAAPAVSGAAGPLVIYGGRPDAVRGWELPGGTPPTSPRGHGLVRVGGGAPLVGGATPTGPDVVLPGGPAGPVGPAGPADGPATSGGFALPFADSSPLSLKAFPGGFATSFSPLQAAAALTPALPEFISPGRPPADTPEPGTLALAALGVGTLTVVTRRRRVGR